MCTKNHNAGRVKNDNNVIMRVSDIKLGKVYSLIKNTITQMQIHRNIYTNTNTNTFVDRVKSGSVIVRESDVKQARKQARASYQESTRVSVLDTNTKSHLEQKKLYHYERSDKK